MTLRQMPRRALQEHGLWFPEGDICPLLCARICCKACPCEGSASSLQPQIRHTGGHITHCKVAVPGSTRLG